MLKYIFVRLIWVFIVLITVITMLFMTIRLVPEFAPLTEEARDTYYAKKEHDGFATSRTIRDPEEIKKIKNKDVDVCNGCYYKEEGDHYRYYEPVPISIQYVRFMNNLLMHWDWGVSTRIQVNQPVFDIFMSRLPVTIKINVVAFFVIIPISFILGTAASLYKDKFIDNLITLGVMVFISVPGFVVMIVMVTIFGYQLDWLPSKFVSSDATGIVRYTSLVLPVVALSFSSIAYVTRLLRAELTEVLTSEFLLLARTKGLSRTQAVIHHAFRNSLVPIVPVLIGEIVGILGGSVIIELIYSIPGTGRLYLQALTQNSFDYNLILALSTFYTIISLFAVLIVDLSYGLIDPRIRMGSKK